MNKNVVIAMFLLIFMVQVVVGLTSYGCKDGDQISNGLCVPASGGSMYYPASATPAAALSVQPVASTPAVPLAQTTAPTQSTTTTITLANNQLTYQSFVVNALQRPNIVQLCTNCATETDASKQNYIYVREQDLASKPTSSTYTVTNSDGTTTRVSVSNRGTNLIETTLSGDDINKVVTYAGNSKSVEHSNGFSEITKSDGSVTFYKNGVEVASIDSFGQLYDSPTASGSKQVVNDIGYLESDLAKLGVPEEAISIIKSAYSKSQALQVDPQVIADFNSMLNLNGINFRTINYNGGSPVYSYTLTGGGGSFTIQPNKEIRFTDGSVTYIAQEGTLYGYNYFKEENGKLVPVDASKIEKAGLMDEFERMQEVYESPEFAEIDEKIVRKGKDTPEVEAFMKNSWQNLISKGRGKLVGMLNSYFEQYMGKYTKWSAYICGDSLYSETSQSSGDSSEFLPMADPVTYKSVQEKQLLEDTKTVILAGEKTELMSTLYRYAVTLKMIGGTESESWKLYLYNSCTGEDSLTDAEESDGSLGWYEYGSIGSKAFFGVHYAGQAGNDMILDCTEGEKCRFDQACIVFENDAGAVTSKNCVSLTHGDGFMSAGETGSTSC